MLAFFKKLPARLVGIEACATSHHWSRELQALGHFARLIPPAYVKPYFDTGPRARDHIGDLPGATLENGEPGYARVQMTLSV